MRRDHKMMMLSVLVAVLLFCSAFPVAGMAASNKPINLTFSTVFLMVHLQAKLNQYFCDEIEKRTDGRVKITLYPGGTLTSATKNFKWWSKDFPISACLAQYFHLLTLTLHK